MGSVEEHTLRERVADLEVKISRESELEPRLAVDPAQALTLLKRLREDPAISMRRLVDLTAIDRGPRAENGMRFEIVYRLQSPGSTTRLRVHVPVETAKLMLDSVVAIWPAAEWLEREVFDLFGIRFRGHPDLRRILLDADFEGAPLRKDFPRQPGLALPKEAEN